jgi:hypothetical protein
MKNLILLLSILALSPITKAQDCAEEVIETEFKLPQSSKLSLGTHSLNTYSTPWYGVIGFRMNNASYTQPSLTAKGSMAYFDISAVSMSEKGFSDFGIPFGGYVLKLLVTGKLNDDHPTGEVPFIYLKKGFDLIKVKEAKIGLGISAISVFMRLPNAMLGYSSLKYGAVSPFIYGKIQIKKFTVVPIFEYHVIKWTDNSDIDRSGFQLGAYVAVPLGDTFAINLNPYYESGKYVSKVSNIEGMKTSNLGFKISLLTSL